MSIKINGGTMQNAYYELETEEKHHHGLPQWRIYEIVTSAFDYLIEIKFFNKDFDFFVMIKQEGIKIKPYSAFKEENRKKILSKYKKGLYKSFSKTEKMICYNDKLDSFTQIVTILHEFGHYILGHTEQSHNGELEADCFAYATLLIVYLEEKNHFSEILLRSGYKTKTFFHNYNTEQEVC